MNWIPEKASEFLAGLVESIFLPKAVSKVWRRWLVLQMQRQLCRTPRDVKNEGHIALQKDHNNLLVTEPKDMEIYDLSNKEFKIAILQKLNKL